MKTRYFHKITILYSCDNKRPNLKQFFCIECLASSSSDPIRIVHSILISVLQSSGNLDEVAELIDWVTIFNTY